MNPQTFVVGNRDADQTVAAFLRVRLNLPWSKAKRLVETGQVRVAGQKTTDPAQRLKLGKRVQAQCADYLRSDINGIRIDSVSHGRVAGVARHIGSCAA